MQQTPTADSAVKRRRIRLGVAAALAVTLFGGTAACGAQPAPSARVASKSSTASATSAPAPAGQTEARTRLRELERSYQGRIGLYALDAGTGKELSYRDGESFPWLSTFKAMAAAAILDKARRSDPGLLERRIHWTADFEVEYSPKTKGRGTEGMTMADICQAAIAYSDNTAANLMLRELGGPAALTRYLRSLGDPRSRLDRWETDLNNWRPGEHRDTTTPASAGQDLRRVSLGDALNPQDRTTLNGWLRANTTGGARIAAGLPDDWTVGDKTGTAESSHGAANDIAVAWPPSGAPLVIAIYTNRTADDGTYDETVIARAATIAARGLGRLP